MPVITLVCEGDFPHAHVGKHAYKIDKDSFSNRRLFVRAYVRGTRAAEA